MSRTEVHGALAYWPGGHTLQALHAMSEDASQYFVWYCPGAHSGVHWAHTRSLLPAHAETWYAPALHSSLHAVHRVSLLVPHSVVLYDP